MYSELEIAATDFTSYTKKRKETMRKVTAERLEKHVGSLARPGQCSKSLRSEFAPGACIERRHSCTWDTFTCPIAVWKCSAVRRRFEVAGRHCGAVTVRSDLSLSRWQLPAAATK